MPNNSYKNDLSNKDAVKSMGGCSSDVSLFSLAKHPMGFLKLDSYGLP